MALPNYLTVGVTNASTTTRYIILFTQRARELEKCSLIMNFRANTRLPTTSSFVASPHEYQHLSAATS